MSMFCTCTYCKETPMTNISWLHMLFCVNFVCLFVFVLHNCKIFYFCLIPNCNIVIALFRYSFLFIHLFSFHRQNTWHDGGSATKSKIWRCSTFYKTRIKYKNNLICIQSYSNIYTNRQIRKIKQGASK